MDTTTLSSLLRSQADLLGDAVLYRQLHDRDLNRVHPTLSYNALDERARAIAHWLSERKVKGQPVLLVFSPGLGFIEALFGCAYAGAIAVPVSPPDPTRMDQGMARLQAIVSDAEATIALCDALVGAAIKTLPESVAKPNGLTWFNVADIETAQAEAWRAPEERSSDLALIQYTSGSTGEPKGVALSHGNLMDNQRLIQSGFGHEVERIRGHEGDFGVTWLPLFHDMGLVGHVFQPLFIGATSNFMSPLAFLRRPAHWLEAITRYRPFTSGAPDFGYRLAARKVSDAVRETLDLSAWRVAYSGAEPVRLESLRAFASRFESAGFSPRALYPTYGLAEATLFVTGGAQGEGAQTLSVDGKALKGDAVLPCEANASGARTLVSCGWSHHETRVKIVNPETLNPCGPSQIGEVWVQGESVAQGYWKAPEKSAELFQATTSEGDGPFLRTGDLGFIREGRLYVTGRQKDLIILRGRNLYPQDIENCIDGAHEALRPGCCAAFSVDTREGEGLVIVQEVRPGAGDPDEVIGTIRRRLLRLEGLRPHAVVLVAPRTLLKTSSGKIRRRACRDAFLQGALRPILDDVALGGEASGRVMPLESLMEQPQGLQAEALLSSLQLALGGHLGLSATEVSTTLPLEDTGLDSMTLVDLTLEIDRQLGVEVDYAWLEGGATLRDLSSSLLGALRSEA